jgi:RNA polymerase sigma factor (sigma-70 family)
VVVDIAADSQDPGPPGVFATTRWSMVLSAGQADSEEQRAHDALAQLCQIYWRPIFSFLSHRGYSAADAQDLTQDFFVMILGNNWLQRADPNRGRFRSLLLTSLQNFLHNAAEKRQTQKRGGHVDFVSWDEWMAEAASQIVPTEGSATSIPPERLFDLRWATLVVEQALRRLREECERKGRLRLFEALSEHLAAERRDMSYAALATSLQINEEAVKKQLHNMRQRYRWLLRDEVAHTVQNPAEVEDEIRYLCAALATGNN